MTARSHSADRAFFMTMAFVAVVLSALGFAPTFYTRPWQAGAPPLSLAVLVHGVVGTLWLATFLAQTVLIAAARPAWHRWLGVSAGVATGVFVASGFVVIAAFERAHGPEPGNVLAAHLFTNVAPLTAFGVLVAAGLWQRAVAARHKRLMLLAAVVLLPPAIGRLFGALEWTRFNLAAYAALAFAGALYDLATRGRPHAVSLGGAAALVAIDVVTTAWLAAVGS